MDGPSVNKSFLKKQRKDLQEHCTCFIDIGTCPLHIVNNSFAKGINSLESVIDLDRFPIDLHFFRVCKKLQKLLCIAVLGGYL